MLRYDYDSLVVLAAVVREGSFESAAKAMRVTQSAVSQRIRQLEEKVGAVLVSRGRPCVPTDAGLQLCRHVEQVELLQHELDVRMSDLVGGENTQAATIRISVNSDSLATWFPNVVKRAGLELGVRFEILTDDQEHTENRLKSGEALAVVTSLETPVQGCRRISLGSMDYIAVCSPEFFRNQFARGVSLDTLRGSTCLTFDRKDTLPRQWMMLCFGEVAPVSPHYVPSVEGYNACCVNGTGWGLLTKHEGLELARQGDLVELSPGKTVKTSLHWQTSTQSSATLMRLGDIVQEEARLHLSPDSFRPV